MFSNKNKLSTKIVIGLIAFWLISVAIIPIQVNADFGEDILTTMGCDDDNNDGLDISDCLSGGGDEPVTSFIDFKGSLQAPNAEGYAEGLTQAQDARTFILNVTNFFLGFLGLIAILVVIYGGVLLVTSTGNPDAMGKAKKALIYAGVGLLLVMGSFAIVNTILLAPSGSEQGTTTGGAINSSTIRGVAGRQRFNYLAKRIDDIILQTYNSYQFHLQTKQEIENVQANIYAYNPGNCTVPMSNCVTQLQSLIDSQFNRLRNLTSNSGANAQFKTGMSKYLNDIIATHVNPQVSSINANIESEDCNSDNKALEINPCSEDNKRAIRDALTNFRDAVVNAMTLNVGFLRDSYKDDINSSTFQTASVYQTIRGISSASIAQQYFSLLIPNFVNQPTSDINAYNPDSENGEFKKEFDNMSILLNIGAPLAGLDQTNIRNILKSLVEIKAILENLQFVDAIISADTINGNAPLIVNFSSVGSTDPSGFSITNDRIEWDLNGDGKFGTFSGEDKEAGLMTCPETNNATASCIFTKAGTYRVTLRIKPKSGEQNPATGLNYDQEIAPGISYIDVLVNPPATKINLEVGPQAGPMKAVILYNPETGTITEDHDKVYFTLAEAKAGLRFDATKSTFSDGTTPLTNDPSSKIRWNFGVASQNNDTYQVPAANTLSLTQVYPEIGNYQVRFEVTDKNGVVDRKIFTVVVSNLAPRITNPPISGKINEEIIFDGSDSTSDGGPIIFNWRVERIGDAMTAALLTSESSIVKTAHAAITDLSQVLAPTAKPGAASLVPAKTLEPTKRKESNEYYDCSMPDGKDDTLKCIFKKAGTYRVTLSLDDDGVPREESTTITISSNEPGASFKASKISDSVPALYVLDATGLSFDPDEEDNRNLEYSWEINPSNCVLIGFADIHTTNDLINASTDAYSSQTPCNKLKDFNRNIGQPVVKFTEKGTYGVNLVVRSIDEPELESAPFEKNIEIDNILDVAWGAMKPSAILQVPGDTGNSPDQLPDSVNPEPVAPITFLFNSSQAVAYELDFGDGVVDSGEMTRGVETQVTHNYNKTGKYTAELIVFDADDIENSISRKIFIGDSDSPIAIIKTLVDGSEVEPQIIQLDGGGTLNNAIVVNRKDNVTFDAEKSINTDGTGRRLKYSWNINNNDKQSTNTQVAYQFKEISDQGEHFVVKLKVTNERDAIQTGEDEVNILVVGELPTLRSLTATATDTDLTTPVSIKLTAVGAEDEDGQITQYKWWYYDANRPVSPDERLGLQISTVPTSTLKIGTRGEEGERPTYRFGVEMTDNDNLTVSTDNRDENRRLNVFPPEIQVTNGPNKAPVARFTVDRTSIQVGETVNFNSSSIDPDAGGGIQEYKWDFGDGTRGENKASVSHVYTKANVDGYRAKLTVVDTNFSEATSDSIKIYVDADAQPPVAGFTIEQQSGGKTVKFTNTSTADEAAGASINKYSWDFDVSNDANGDGKKDNDIQSGEINPSYTYPDFGVYRAKLTVEDDQGQQGSVTNFVNLKPAEALKTATLNGGITPVDVGAANPGTKSLAANVFQATTQIDPSLLMASLGGYGILFANHRRKKRKDKNQK